MTAGSILTIGATAFLLISADAIVRRRPLTRRIEIAAVSWFLACAAAHASGMAWQ